MKILMTPIIGVSVVETTPIIDQRGTFFRCFCEHELAAIIGSRRIMQINFSRSLTVGAVRGLHFQYPPHPEMKLVRCLKGKVWDVAVDLRAGSPNFLHWHAEVLTPGNARMMSIPEGCAHGFQVLEADSELLYLHTASYAPESDGGVPHDDPRLAIAWPLPVADLSDRDRRHAYISPKFAGIIL
jgi:dTDP-4-dehydrorhamnose 3,5-epimerase